MSIKQVLSGENAFYSQPHYEQTTRDELASSAPLNSPAYNYTTESKVWRVVKDVLSVIIFPIGLYRFLHFVAGKIILLSSSPALLQLSPNHADERRTEIPVDGEWKVKRVTVAVDGYLIDAAIMGKPSTLGNGRWLLYTNGNGEFYEDRLQNPGFKRLLSALNGNALVFNYPGAGASSGFPNRSAMTKAYHAMLHFLEDQEKGIGAKEIIGYGLSIGGGVQGNALYAHQLKEGVKYVFIKDRTFSDLSAAASHLTIRLLGLFVRLLGWNMSSVASSKKLRAPEIIMQTANVSGYEDISDQARRVVHDRVIAAEASLARALLSERGQLLGRKYFMGIPEYHNGGLQNPGHLVKKVNEMLQVM